MIHDVLAFGEALLRLTPAGDDRIEDAPLFRAHVGGSELNVCCALAGLGLRTAWFSLLPEGPTGRRVLRHLRAAGVDVSFVKTTAGRIGVYWTEGGRAPRPVDVVYDRLDSTVSRVRPEDAPWEGLKSARVFLVSGITLALSPEVHDLALALARAAREAGVMVVTDLNYRAKLWPVETAAPALLALAREADIVIVTEEDLRLLYGQDGDSALLAQAARERFACRLALVTRGERGAVSSDASGTVRHADAVASASVDRVGAGDAFAAGALYATLAGRADRTLDYGLAMAALKRSLPGDNVSLTAEELERAVARESTDIRR